MTLFEWLLETILIGLLAATLFHAFRLERAIGALKRDRAELEATIRQFLASTSEAEAGLEKLREAANGAARPLARQIEEARPLVEDLRLLIAHAEKIADRLDQKIREGRLASADPLPVVAPAEDEKTPRPRSQAERELLKALRMVR
jgi:chromosome segregation ATPase